MNISVVGQHISLKSELQEYVKEKIQEVTERYFGNATSSSIHFAKDGRNISCDIVVNEGAGGHVVIHSEAVSDEVYSSFELALVKAEKCLRKYKSRLKDRHGKTKISEVAFLTAKKKIFNDQIEFEEEPSGPAIIAERAINIPKVTVSEAVMKMELENLPAVMFQNSKTDRVNMVYFRKDGNIAWVDSE
jgi:ribosomal subunit interface protein